MQFRYRARGSDGEVLEGRIEAEDRRSALDALRQEGMVVTALEPLEEGGESKRGSLWERLQQVGTVPARVRTIFFRQMATMVKSGLGLPSALDILAEQEENPIFKRVLRDLKEGLNRGVPLSQAMRRHRVFDPLTISMIQAGEEGGLLDEALDRVAGLLEKQAELRGRVRSALLYPAFVALFALLVLVLFVAVILPQFRQVFDAMHVELPGITRFMSSLGTWGAAHWRGALLSLASVLGLLVWLFTSRATSGFMDGVKVRLPLVGKLLLKSSLARSSRTLAALVAAGVPILRCLEMSAATAGNAVVRKALDGLREAAQQGTSLGDAAKQFPIFPTLVSQMLRIGEETGRLDSMMDRVASWYEQDLEGQIRALTSLLGPTAILLVGGVVALIAFSVFGPIMSAMSQIR